MGKVQFPLESYVSLLYDSSVKKVDEYILMVELQGVPYKVYREVSVPSNLYVGYFGEILVIAMGWGNYHMHEISKDGFYYMRPYNIGIRICWFMRLRHEMRFSLLWRILWVASSELVYDSGDS